MGWWKDLLSCHQFQSFSASVWLSESLNIKQLYFQVGSWRVSRWSVKIGNSCSWVMLTLGIIGLHSQGNTNSPSTVDRQDPQESPRRCSDKSSSTSYGSSGTWSERWLGCTCRYHCHACQIFCEEVLLQEVKEEEAERVAEDCYAHFCHDPHSMDGSCRIEHRSLYGISHFLVFWNHWIFH